MALITAAEARIAIPNLSGSSVDTMLETVIARVGAALAAYCDYPRRGAGNDATLESAEYTLYSGGLSGRIRVAEDGGSLALPVRPITSVTSVHDDPNQDYSATFLVSSSDYTTEAVDGVIRLRPTNTHGVFSSTPYAVKVVATCGFATTPEAVKEAAVLTVRHLVDKHAAGLATSVSLQGQSVQLQSIEIPAEAKALLAPFRLMGGVAA